MVPKTKENINEKKLNNNANGTVDKNLESKSRGYCPWVNVIALLVADPNSVPILFNIVQ